LVVSFAWDQPDIGERVARLGIARSIPRSQFTPSRVAAELRQLLESTTYLRPATEVAASALTSRRSIDYS
jgi:UDP:flavonoid glycosyltransferase YjiC (YdhE family)